MQRGRTLWVVVAIALLLTPALMAQTTGGIEGRAVDANGDALPGVTVMAKSPKLIGERTTMSDADGSFRFPSVPPGTYNVRAELSGFSSIEQNVQVGIDRTVTLELRLSEAVQETITVTGEGPVVDVTSNETGISVGSEVFEQLPTARDFYAVAQLAPSVGEDDYGTTVGGATSAENQYVIEGLNTTGVELGIEGKTLNFEFIDEVEVKTGGLSAEYGRMTGGVVNAVTKSGGNEFEGDVFGYYEGGSLKSDNSTGPDRPATTTQIVDVEKKQDYGLDLGGYLVKDKLWFFAAYNAVDQDNESTIVLDLPGPGAPQSGDIVGANITRDLWAGKLTWAANSSNTLTASIFGDPSTREGNVFTIRGPESTWKGVRDTGSEDYILRYDGVFGGSWVVEGAIGAHNEEDKTSGPGKNLPGIVDSRSGATVAPYGGFWFHQDQEFERQIYKVNVSKYAGNHEFKLGGDIEDITAKNENWNGGAGQRIYIFDSSSVGTFYRHRFYVDASAPGFDRNDPTTWVPAVPLTTEPETTNTSFFAQDSWRLMPNFTLNLGVRWEEQEVGVANSDGGFSISDNWAPRVGFVWDVMANGRSKLYANYGRYFLSVPMDINIRAFGGEVSAFTYNFSDDPNNFQPVTDAGLPGSRLLGGATTPVDPDLKGQYVDEYLLGFEYEIAPNFAVGVQGTYRDLGRVIEDFLIIELGNYFISNPGEGIGTEVTMFDYDTAPASATREYTAITLTARKRFSDGWQLIASYVWSELEGNYDGAYQVSTGQLDPGINSAFDYGDFLINAQGKLSLDQTHVFKLDGSYLFTEGAVEGLNIGASAYWRSGYPLNAYGYNFYYGNYENYLVPRGSLGEGPSDYEMDLHIGYPIQIGDRASVDVMVDVFNLLDRQSKQRVDERYNLNSGDTGCDGIPDDICNSDPFFGGLDHLPGSTEPAGSLSNPRSTATNPDYLTAGTQFSGARSIRLGVKFSF